MRETIAGQMMIDERGKWSSTRLSLFVGLAMSMVAFAAETFGGISVANVYHEVNKLLIGVMGVSTGVRGALRNRAEAPEK